MRGQKENQGFMFTYLSPEQRVPNAQRVKKIMLNLPIFTESLAKTSKLYKIKRFSAAC